MELYIEKETSLESVQEKFNKFYPFLKIQLYKNATAKNKRLYQQTKVNSFSIAPKVDSNLTTINIAGGRTLAEVKNDFREALGLYAQIFRKFGNVWVETSLTDDWTLDRQNKEGELLSSFNNFRTTIF